jgi:hypothetical protein
MGLAELRKLMNTTYSSYPRPTSCNYSRRTFTLAAIALLFSLAASGRAAQNPVLAYSFEDGVQGFGPNGGGITVSQDTIGATNGTHSLKVSLVGGQTFAGALTSTIDPSIYGNPPGLDHVLFDLTIVQRFDILNPNPPPDRLGFARIGVFAFGATQPDGGGMQIFDKAQLANVAEDEVPIGNLEPGTYRDLRIDMDKLTDPLDFGTKSFNQIFGVLGSGSDLIPTGFQFYINKSGGADFPLTIYIDNVRFGTSVPGDYNGNDVVDAADYVLWKKTTSPTPASFRNEVASIGTIDAADYAAWRARFGNFMPSPGSGSGLDNGAVPEPTSIWLVLMGGSAIGCLRRKALAR